MFETAAEGAPIKAGWFSLWRFLLQTVVVYPIVFLTLRPILAIGRDPKTWTYPQSNLADIGIVAVGGLLVGVLVQLKLPRFARTGRWVWILPCVFLVGGVITQTLHPPPVAAGPSEYFYSSTSNEGLAVFLITLPASCLIGYALPFWVGGRLRGTTRKGVGSGMGQDN